MTRLVEDLLTLARADAGEEQLRREPVDVAALVEEAADALQWVNDGHTLELDVADGLVVNGDAHRLGQLLRGLVDNALKHSPANGTVSIVARQVGGQVRIDVSDDGPGIPPAQMPLIFERFYRVDRGRSRRQGGTGLGLAICKWIAEAHGGRIDVASRLGEGATFTVELPSAKASGA